ncbi:Glycine/sarcosine/betaine reductase selenoprotein B (GRDB) [Geobacter sp. DSM 9736]|nr:glycine/sarcosine/betaine reductase selenoprotein B family protein [Geobacter sp. DSM 9736]SNB45406.1 Glycine/sarcosine/betaine reductase selenoprotein B (GRDB) [Geobacter sp. DSM 9736]
MIRFSHTRNVVMARIFTAFPSLAARWGQRLQMNTSLVPWAEPGKPLREAVVALVTTGGVHLKSQKPFDMSDSNGDASFREIPVSTPREALTITHDYYDHRDADTDVNLVLPVERLQELVERGVVGALHPVAYAFMGHIDDPHLNTLVRISGPEVAGKLADAKVDYVLLVPA